jgi:AcrR family transcriptional regulator
MAVNSSAPDAERASARRQATRARLLEAATAEIGERGYHATSIEHIAERAGFTRGAFYSNFENKEQLFAEALEVGRRTLVGDLEAQLATTGLPIDRDGIDQVGVEQAVELILRGLPKETAWYVLNVEADLLAARDPIFAALTRESATRFLDDLGQLVERTIAEYGLRFTIDSRQVIRVLFGYFSAALREAVLEGGADDIKRSVAQRAQTVTRLLIAIVEPIPQA